MSVCGPQYAGRVDQRIQAAERLDGQAHAVDDRVLIGDVHLQGCEPVTGCGLVCARPGLVQAVRRDVGGHHGGTLVQQPQRGGLADARRGAGHQDPLAFESLHLLIIASSGPNKALNKEE